MMDSKHITAISKDISKESETLAGILSDLGSSVFIDDAGSRGDSPTDVNVLQIRTRLLEHIRTLERALRGPDEFLHHIIGFNWDKGALYTLIENNVIHQLPSSGTIALTSLAEKTSIPAEKLLPVLRLAACDDVVQELDDGQFSHGSVSKRLLNDPGLMAFIGFQLYETRVASAHLADSLKRPNPFWTGQSAFEYAWGEPMYGWHRSHPEKGERFKDAMKSVTEQFDPGKSLLQNWFSSTVEGSPETGFTLIDITRFPTGESHFLSEMYPSVTFQEYELKGVEVSGLGQTSANATSIYYLNSILWNLADEDCIKLLKVFATLLDRSPSSSLLVNDLLSPLPGQFEPHLDKAYRRRDVTVMTMHNAKLRTLKEWEEVFLAADPSFSIKVSEGNSSHSCRGLWELNSHPSEAVWHSVCPASRQKEHAEA